MKPFLCFLFSICVFVNAQIESLKFDTKSIYKIGSLEITEDSNGNIYEKNIRFDFISIYSSKTNNKQFYIESDSVLNDNSILLYNEKIFFSSSRKSFVLSDSISFNSQKRNLQMENDSIDWDEKNNCQMIQLNLENGSSLSYAGKLCINPYNETINSDLMLYLQQFMSFTHPNNQNKFSLTKGQIIYIDFKEDEKEDELMNFILESTIKEDIIVIMKE